MLAAWNSNVETVQMLCQHRASTFAKNDDFEDVFDQVPNMDKAEKKKLDLVLQAARNEEIDSWNVGYQEHNRVMYEKDNKEGGAEETNAEAEFFFQQFISAGDLHFHINRQQHETDHQEN